MTRVLALLALLLAIAAPAAAQGNPCDLAPQLVATKGTKVGFCALAKDEDGIAIDVYNFKIVISSTVSATWTNATPTVATPNATGYLYFEAGLPVVSRGTRPVQVIQYTPEGDSPASSTALWQVGGKPVAPVIKGVK